MPVLYYLRLPKAFKHPRRVATTSGGIRRGASSRIDIGELACHPHIANDTIMEPWSAEPVSLEIRFLVIQRPKFDFWRVTTLDMREYKRLVCLVIEEECFKHVTEFNVTGLTELMNVAIGRGCFSAAAGCFYAVDCPKLRQLVIGEDPESDVVARGTSGDNGACNQWSTLELKSRRGKKK